MMKNKINKFKFSTKYIFLGTLLAQLLFINSVENVLAADDSIEKQRLPSASPDDTDDALADLLSTLGKETEIATRTKMNIDFVPGMVTVLHGRDLLAKGIRNVFEALQLVPGVDLNIAGDGQTQLIFRGIGKLFASGKVKVMVNGLPFNSTFTAQTALTTFPIEQIERIEVVRGPGSAIYGEFAYAGVIDVITKSSESEIYTRYGDLDTKTVGGIFAYKDPVNDYSVSLNVSATESGSGDTNSGEDRLFGTPLQPISNAPGPVNDDEERLAVIFKLDFKGLTFAGEKTKREFGNYFGATNALPEPDAGTVRTADYQVFELSAPLKLRTDATAQIKIGWASFLFEADDQLLNPAGFAGGFPNGVLASPHYEEDKYYAGLEFQFQNIGKHAVLLGFDYARIEQGDTSVERNFIANPPPAPPTEIPPTIFTGPANFMTEANSRSIIGVYLQDQYALSDKLNITAGFRYDDYDDVGASTTPRLAAVYRLNNHQTLKFQYAEAFRPPTFIELYSQNNPIVNGNAGLMAETIKNYEFGYVYNDGVTTARLTVFDASLEGLIGEGSTIPVTFQNIGQAKQTGMEIEYDRQIRENIKIDSSLSFVDVHDDVTNVEFADIARLLLNLGVLYQPMHNISVGVQFRHVGERDRGVGDARKSLDGFNTVDVTASMFNALIRKLTFRAGIKNIFDEDIFYPSPTLNTYQNDFPQPGRELWLSLSYKF